MLYVDLDGHAKFTKFGASKSQKVSEHFSIEHFAGPAVYTTEYFIEKNRDSLPQGTAALLKHSDNHIVASSSAVVGR
jgi:myosin heavy subunit